MRVCITWTHPWSWNMLGGEGKARKGPNLGMVGAQLNGANTWEEEEGVGELPNNGWQWGVVYSVTREKPHHQWENDTLYGMFTTMRHGRLGDGDGGWRQRSRAKTTQHVLVDPPDPPNACVRTRTIKAGSPACSSAVDGMTAPGHCTCLPLGPPKKIEALQFPGSFPSRGDR